MEPQKIAPTDAPDSDAPVPESVPALQSSIPSEPVNKPEAADGDKAASSGLAIDSQATRAAEPQPILDETVNPLPMAGAPKPRKKGLLFGLITAAVVLLLSGAAAASYYYVATKPENVLKHALANSFDASKVKTVQFSGAFTIKSGSGNFGFDFTGTGSNETGAFDLTSTIDAMVTKLTLDARSTDGKTFYLKVGGLKSLSTLVSSMAASDEAAATYGPLIISLDDQWLEINQSLLSRLNGGKNIQKLSAADLQKLADAYSQHAFLVVKKKLSDEKIKGVNSYHYAVAIDKTQLKAFLAAVKSANIQSLAFTDEQLATAQQSIDEAQLDTLIAEVWIGKSTKMISQVTLSISEGAQGADLRVTIDSYNNPVVVQKPTGAKSLLEVMSGFVSGGGLPGISL